VDRTGYGEAGVWKVMLGEDKDDRQQGGGARGVKEPIVNGKKKGSGWNTMATPHSAHQSARASRRTKTKRVNKRKRQFHDER
jgi:hypothetical protein